MKGRKKRNSMESDVELACEVLKVGGGYQIGVEHHHSLHKVQAQRASSW